MAILKRGKKFAKKISTVMIISLVMTSLIGCSNETTKEEKTQLNAATNFIAATLDPAVNWDSWTLVKYGVGETLVKLADDASYEPWLAESWECADDDLTWTIKLKDNVKFSNGEPMTATKVVESLERLYEMEDPDKGGAGNPHGYFTYESIKADDEKGTVTIVTTNKTPDLPGCLAYPWTCIIDAEGSKGKDVKSGEGIFTGPYTVSKYKSGENLELTRNEEYWDGDVQFETINLKNIPDSATAALSLQDKSIDVANNISSVDIEKLKDNSEYNVSVISGSRNAFGLMNMNGILKNSDLRKAIVMAVDGQTIADVTTNKAYEYGFAVLSPNLDYGYDKLKNTTEYDVEKAKKILDDANIVDTNGDGYRELDGKEIELDYVTTKARQSDVTTQAQATQLEEIGIKVDVNIMESAVESLSTGNFDLLAYGEVTVPTGDPSKFLKHWYSKSDDNYSNYKNEEYDEIFEKLIDEFDTEKRKEHIVQLQQIIIDDAAALVSGYNNFGVVSTGEVEGLRGYTSDFYLITKDVKPSNK